MNWKILPNVITGLRLFLLIPLGYYLINQDYKTAVWIFFIAGSSDALDGFLAKRFGWVSRIGSILDPIADKALLVLTMGILTFNQQIAITLFSLVAIRDIYILIGAAIYYKNIGPFDMQPSWLSKFNTFAQILLVTCLLVSVSYFQLPEQFIDALVALVYLSVVSSGIHYTIAWRPKYLKALKQKNKLNNKQSRDVQ
ncbi:MAG: CDP-alcohol phosphatidyltransferase family protein [Enterobacterales bacterium]|nr:CDP-alcohol phosphatidyltransferase family protein [Enterobacterales bacterium]